MHIHTLHTMLHTIIYIQIEFNQINRYPHYTGELKEETILLDSNEGSIAQETSLEKAKNISIHSDIFYSNIKKRNDNYKLAIKNEILFTDVPKQTSNMSSKSIKVPRIKNSLVDSSRMKPSPYSSSRSPRTEPDFRRPKVIPKSASTELLNQQATATTPTTTTAAGTTGAATAGGGGEVESEKITNPYDEVPKVINTPLNSTAHGVINELERDDTPTTTNPTGTAGADTEGADPSPTRPNSAGSDLRRANASTANIDEDLDELMLVKLEEAAHITPPPITNTDDADVEEEEEEGEGEEAELGGDGNGESTDLTGTKPDCSTSPDVAGDVLEGQAGTEPASMKHASMITMPAASAKNSRKKSVLHAVLPDRMASHKSLDITDTSINQQRIKRLISVRQLPGPDFDFYHELEDDKEHLPTHIYDMKKRIREITCAETVSNEAKASRILEYIIDMFSQVYLRCRHIVLILRCFQFGSIQRVQSFGTYNVELIVSLFIRILDIHHFEMVLGELTAEECGVLYCRLGWLNLYNPVKADGGYELRYVHMYDVCCMCIMYVYRVYDCLCVYPSMHTYFIHPLTCTNTLHYTTVHYTILYYTIVLIVVRSV